MRAQSGDWPSWTLSPRQLADLELLVDGSYAPLPGFLDQRDHASVLSTERLADATPWPVPITLDVTAEVADQAEQAGRLGLRDPEGVLLAVLTVADRFRADPEAEAHALFATADPGDPDVDRLMRHTHRDRLGGPIEGVEVPTHWDFRTRRATPATTRERIGRSGAGRIVGYATAEPMHQAEVALVNGAVGPDALVLVLGLIGPGPAGAVDPYSLVRCWDAASAHLAPSVSWALAPLSGDRGARRQPALIERVLRNYGATEIIEAVPDAAAAPAGNGSGKALAATEVRRRLDRGEDLPVGFTFPEVEAELRQSIPARSARGLTVFMTGLSGSGKSTVAQALAARLREHGGRSVALLDGDRVRLHLSSELGFSRHDRDLNIRRIGFVAAEITRAGGIALCAPIAPYDEVRRDVRSMVSEAGSFVLVHISTPLETCEARDRKGLYAKARAGVIPEFTGISDPYEVPTDAELAVDTSDIPVDEAVSRIVSYLEAEGYLTIGHSPR